MSDEPKSYDFVYVETDIPSGMTIREWRRQRADALTAASDAVARRGGRPRLGRLITALAISVQRNFKRRRAGATRRGVPA